MNNSNWKTWSRFRLSSISTQNVQWMFSLESSGRDKQRSARFNKYVIRKSFCSAVGSITLYLLMDWTDLYLHVFFSHRFLVLSSKCSIGAAMSVKSVSASPYQLNTQDYRSWDNPCIRFIVCHVSNYCCVLKFSNSLKLEVETWV